MRENPPKKTDDSAGIEQKHLQTGKIQHEHSGERKGAEESEVGERMERESSERRESRERREGEGRLGSDSHSRIEDVPQAPLQGPDQREVNRSEVPGEIAENMGLNQTYSQDEEDTPPERSEGADPDEKRSERQKAS